MRHWHWEPIVLIKTNVPVLVRICIYVSTHIMFNWSPTAVVRLTAGMRGFWCTKRCECECLAGWLEPNYGI